MSNQPILSIIIPCFNAEPYLEVLFENLHNQDLNSCEIIFIDDGSKDRTKEIIKSWVSTRKDTFFYFQENKGVSSARNLGISKASGTYISFLDCDDYYLVDGVKNIKEELDFNYDVIVFGYLKDWQRNHKTFSYSCYKGNYSSEKFLYLFFCRKIKFLIGSFIVRRQLLIENNIIFYTEYRIGEDFDFYYKVISVSKRIRYNPDVIFGYRIHINSTTSNYLNYNIDMFNSFLLNSKNAENYFLTNNKLQEEAVYFRKYAYVVQLILYLRSKNVRDLEIESLFESHRCILKLAGGLRINLVHSLIFLFFRLIPLKFLIKVFKRK